MMFWFKKKNNYPLFYTEYLEKIEDEGFSKNLLSFDMETNGLDPKNSEVLSFGSVLISNDKILPSEELHLFFNSKEENETIYIHELMHTQNELDVLEALPLLMSKISNHTLLGHFVSFDIALVNNLLKKLKLPKLKNPKLDTLELALKVDGVHDYSFASKDNYTLYALCDRFDIDVLHTHDALSDAYLTALVYFHLKV